MEERTTGTILSVAKMWWLKVNTKPVRLHAMDGARFPHVVKVQYGANGTEYIRRKWVGIEQRTPREGDRVKVFYRKDKPARCRIEL